MMSQREKVIRVFNSSPGRIRVLKISFCRRRRK
jgi:hypothetical protein